MILRKPFWSWPLGFGLLLLGNLGGCPFPPTDANQPGDSNTPVVEPTLHEKIFTEILTAGYQGPQSCVACHSDEALDLFQTGHWKWQGTSVNIDGQEAGTHGKRDLINNFCIAVPSNEGRCSQCHPSYGWKSNTPASFFADINNVDCLICHDTTDTYRKHPSAGGGGGAAALLIDGTVTAVGADRLQDVAYNVGTPRRQNCGQCHFSAGGGDGVKYGDLSSALNEPSGDLDVHMGGMDYSCQVCHTADQHGIAGFQLHDVDEGGASPDCTRCHGTTNVHTQNRSVRSLLNLHLDRVACQTCHIPTFARELPTKVEWYWSEAGQDISPIPVDALGKQTYDKMKGRFVWAKSVQPTYLWFDGKWQRRIINVTDTFANAGTVADPVVLAAPTASSATTGAKIYPFKKMIGDQPADSVNHRLLVPHLFGTGTGLSNPYWATYQWGPALAEGAAYAGQPYSGSYEFVHTVMYLRVNHEVAPKEQALSCEDCHGVPAFWTQVGLTDPLAR